MALCCLVTPFTVAALAQTSGPSAMIVFDGSGSMWGRLDGDKKQSKLELAREAVRTILTVAPGQPTLTTRIGLMSFGHRRQGDCSDIEIISQPAALTDPARIMAPLDKLNPRGKGPIANAIKEAAKALGTEQPASIVLIHDNADNCRMDACETAGELASTHPKLHIHVVALGMDRDELTRVSCIAKATGGQLFDVRDAAGIAPAVTDAMKLALAISAQPPRLKPGAAPQQEAAPAAPAPAIVPAGPPGLRLRAHLSVQSRQLTLPVAWQVFKPGSVTPLFEGYGPEVTVPVEPGPYVVEGKIGFATRRVEVTAAQVGPTPVELSLEAASVRLKISEVKDGPLSTTAQVILKSVALGSAAAPATRPLWIGQAPDADLVLPAGSYVVVVEDSLVERSELLVLAAGDAVDKDIVLSAGRLELTAVAKADGPLLDGVTFLIAKDDPDAPEGRREIVRSSTIKAQFVLPSGTYYVTARTGSAEVRQRIGIGAGDYVKRAIVLGLGRLTIVAADVPTSKAATAAPSVASVIAAQKLAMTTRIMSLEGEPHEVARSTAIAPEFTLAAGRYRIESAIGSQNVKATQDLDLESGANRRVSLKLDANTLNLRATGPGANDVTWDVRDGQGLILLRSSGQNPRLVLAPGRYTVRCDAQGKASEKTVDITADGQPRTLDFVVP